MCADGMLFKLRWLSAFFSKCPGLCFQAFLFRIRGSRVWSVWSVTSLHVLSWGWGGYDFGNWIHWVFGYLEVSNVSKIGLLSWHLGTTWILFWMNPPWHALLVLLYLGFPHRFSLASGLNGESGVRDRWLSHPSEKYESQLGWWHSQYMGSHKIHVPTQQPVNIWTCLPLAWLWTSHPHFFASPQADPIAAYLPAGLWGSPFLPRKVLKSAPNKWRNQC